MKTHGPIASGLVAVALPLLAGCASRGVSDELVDARRTVERAQASEASERAPAELFHAERVLKRAERADDGSIEERHLAYLADRQARIAMADGRTAALSESMVAAQRAYVAELERSVGAAAPPPRAQTAPPRAHAETGSADAARQAAEVAAEERRAAEEAAAAAEAGRRTAEDAAAQAESERAATESALDEALDRIEEVAEVRKEPNQTVITLTGEVLFETDEAKLLPTARRKLSVVADSLGAEPEGRIVVAGHTDSQGTDEYNRALSERRANSVKNFLVDQGVPESRIETVGRGETQPIAENASPEGRANNRRVEIILPREPEPSSAQQAPRSQHAAPPSQQAVPPSRPSAPASPEPPRPGQGAPAE